MMATTELSLPHLQNLIKRDAESYKDDFQRQLRYFESTLAVFRLSPQEYNKSLEESVMFLAQVAKCFPADLANFPSILVDLLRENSSVLDPDMRTTFCRALILLRHRDLLSPTDLLTLFFGLFKCQDKALRKFLRDHIVNDIKGINSKKKDAKTNSSLQNFMFKMLRDSEVNAAKISLEIMIELYRKNIWNDTKTVNVIAEACLSDVNKVSVTAIKFFLGKDSNDEEKKNDDSDSEDEMPTVRDVTMANKFNKKSRKRERMLENIKKAHKKKKKKDKAASFNFSALHLINDPQGFAEKLFKKLDTLKEKFEVKLLFLDLISRLIGTHELFILNYYAYIARFLNPHQREVVQMLQFAAQAAHEMVPADAVEPVLRAIADNFVTERNAAEVMAVGLNAIRELCNRCPLAIDETLLRDLAAYKTYKDKGVMMAARSIILLYRNTHPELLHKKDRGRPTEAVAENEAKQYGEMSVKGYVPGAEVLDGERGSDQEDEEEDDDESDWENVEHSSDDEGDDDEEGDKQFMTLEEKRVKAAENASSRIFTDADFKKIDAAQLKKQVSGFRKGGNKKNLKRKRQEAEDDDGGEENEAKKGRQELVDLADIEMVHKKRRHDKEARLASVMEGRKGREKFGSKKGRKEKSGGSTTNKVKAKQKNFMMLKHKLKAKAKKSFVEKAKDLKKSMLRSRKFYK